MPSQSWTLLESRHLSDHRIFRIRQDHYRLEPADAERDFVVIDSPDWVDVVPLTPDRQVVLVRQYRHGLRRVTLEIPGGIVDANESPQEAAVRELREETGYVAQRVQSLGRVASNPAIQNNFCHMFLAEGCRPTAEPRPDPFERIEVLLRPLDEMEDLIRRGEICHSLVISAFAFLGIMGARSFRPGGHDPTIHDGRA